MCRRPCVSPYSKPSHVSNVVYDHTSVLKMIEANWNLPRLTNRDRAANNPLDDMVDFNRATFLTPPKLADPARPWRSPEIQGPRESDASAG